MVLNLRPNSLSHILVDFAPNYKINVLFHTLINAKPPTPRFQPPVHPHPIRPSNKATLNNVPARVVAPPSARRIQHSPMRDSHYMHLSLDQILANLETPTAVAASLDELGTLLRDEQTRAQPAARHCVFRALDSASSHPLPVLRVLVNFCADNDRNRALLVTSDLAVVEFWTWLFTQLHDAADPGVCTRAIILLGQFIHNMQEEQVASAVGALVERGAVSALAEHLKRSGDVLGMEVLAECARVRPEAVETAHLEWIVAAAEAHADGETLEHASAAIFSATNVDSRSGVQVVPALYRLLQKVPANTANAVHIKRRLFSACGNISSYASYDNWADVARNEAAVEAADAYVVAAAAISLGNCVRSHADQARLLRTLASPARVVGAVLRAPLADVVQYQAFHLLCNTMTAATADTVLGHAELLARATKVVVDNLSYYREVGAVYFKFLRRLVAQGDARRVLLLAPVWAALDQCDDAAAREVRLLLLQAACAPGAGAAGAGAVDRGLVRRLVCHSVEAGGTVDAHYVLQQIKTVAVVLRHYSADDMVQLLDDAETHFVLPLARLLGQLQHAVSGAVSGAATGAAAVQSPAMAGAGVGACEPAQAVAPGATGEARAHGAAPAVANNTRFLAASALQFGAGRSAGAWAQLAAVCHAILQPAA